MVCDTGLFCNVVVDSVYTVVRVWIDKEHGCNSVLSPKALSRRAHALAQKDGDKHNLRLHLLDRLSDVIVGKYSGAIFFKSNGIM